MMIDQSLGMGIFFDSDAYAGLMRRLVMVMVDSVVLLITGILMFVPFAMLLWDPQTGRTPDGLFLGLWILVTWLYLTVVKRSRFRTLGYRVAGVRIITTDGSRPSLAMMTFRLMLWIFGPFNFVLDLLWLGVDSEQQTLRDCYAGTYVVKTGAQPLGVGPVHLTRYFAAGLAPSYPRVVRRDAQRSGDST